MSKVRKYKTWRRLFRNRWWNVWVSMLVVLDDVKNIFNSRIFSLLLPLFVFWHILQVLPHWTSGTWPSSINNAVQHRQSKLASPQQLHFPTAQLHNCQLPWQLWRFVCGITNCCGATLKCQSDLSVRSIATKICSYVIAKFNVIVWYNFCVFPERGCHLHGAGEADHFSLRWRVCCCSLWPMVRHVTVSGAWLYVCFTKI